MHYKELMKTMAAMRYTIGADNEILQSRIHDFRKSWMRDFPLTKGEGSPADGFTALEVENALDHIHRGASGLDGTSRKWICPLRQTRIPIMIALFNN